MRVRCVATPLLTYSYAKAADMKFVTQITLTIFAIIGVVAGITYVSQYYNKPPKSTGSGGSELPSTETLFFPVKIMTWDPITTGQFELRAPGHQDFVFSNKNQIPVELGLVNQSCKCSEIEACALTAEEMKRFQVDAVANAAATIASATGVLGYLAQAIKDGDATPDLQAVRLKWQTLEPQNVPHVPKPTGNSVVVPPGGGGLVRFDWDGKKTKEGQERLTIDLYTQPKQGKVARDYIRLELPLTFTPALRAMPEKLELGELGPRETKTVEFVCWSATRAGFQFGAQVLPADPCVTCEWAPINPDECLKVADQYQSRVLAAYRVRITVRERTEQGRQLDIGPFGRRVALTSDVGDDEANIPLIGMVVGEFIVGSDEDKGKVQLESFNARTGTSKEIIILARQSGAELQSGNATVEPSSLDYVKASLKSDGLGRWRLLVKVRDNCPAGRFPQNASVALKIAGDQNRQLRIPLRGIAFKRQ
jgi:hypothetical protein